MLRLDRASWRKLSGETAILVSILMIAAFFRFYRLDEIPPGMRFDEAFNGFDVLRLLQGQFAIFFPANNGREPLYLYLSTVSVALLGPQAPAFRLTSAIIGTATVPLVYGFTRSLFRSGQVAIFAALFTAISVWHIYYSRYGLRVILVVPLTILTLWWFWRALSPTHPSPVERGRVREGVWRDYAFVGLSAALAVYTYLGARLLPVILVTLTIFAIVFNRAQAGIYIRGLSLTGVVAWATFLPLGLYFLANPEQFATHVVNLSLLDPRVNKGDIFAAFWKNLDDVAGMFLLRGDHEVFRNIANRPVFDPFMGVLFVIGLAMLLVAALSPRSSNEERLRAILIAVCLVVLLGASVFSDDPPNFTRTLATVPFAMLLPAWAAAAIWGRLSTTAMRQVAAGALGAIVFASALLAFRDYFIEFGRSPALYIAFDVEKIDAANWINQDAPTNHIFLAPLWYQQGTLSLLTRNTPLKSFESRDTVVLPSNAEGKDALIAFPLEQEKKAAKLGERLGPIAVREDLVGSSGATILLIYRVPARNLPDPQDPLKALARGGTFLQPQKIEHANWANQIELFGHTVDPEGPGGRNLVVTLFLQSLKPMAEDYTFSIKVRDEKDRVWGQEDKWPGNNSYETTRWGVGDVVIERFYPGLHACAPAGDYRITVEAYNPQTMRVLALTDREGNAVVLGTTHADPSRSNRLEDLEPDQKIDAEVASQLRLMGYTLTPDTVRAGESFSLSLFWRGQGDGTALPHAIIRLRDSSKRDFVLAEQSVAIPIEGRGLCTLFDSRAPPDLSPGTASISVNDVQITSLNIAR